MAYKVLVVDDQAMPRQLFDSMIRSSQEFELVACISSAKMADLYCATGDVDLILMDVVMNDGSNGIDISAKLKKSYPEVKIIIMTSMPDANFLAKAKAAGVESFWYKEVQDTPMLDIMSRTMKGEHIFPDMAPDVRLGMAMGSEFTDREMEVLRQLVRGYTDKEIADVLNMSYHTVRFHINSLLGKTGCVSRTELAIRATQCGIVVPEM